MSLGQLFEQESLGQLFEQETLGQLFEQKTLGQLFGLVKLQVPGTWSLLGERMARI